jgi:hypothetical protein
MNDTEEEKLAEKLAWYLPIGTYISIQRVATYTAIGQTPWEDVAFSVGYSVIASRLEIEPIYVFARTAAEAEMKFNANIDRIREHLRTKPAAATKPVELQPQDDGAIRSDAAPLEMPISQPSVIETISIPPPRMPEGITSEGITPKGKDEACPTRTQLPKQPRSRTPRIFASMAFALRRLIGMNPAGRPASSPQKGSVTG